MCLPAPEHHLLYRSHSILLPWCKFIFVSILFSSSKINRPSFIFLSIYSLTRWATPFFPSCFFSSHLIPWINFSGTALPPRWQVLWLKRLLARFKWEADCRFEAREGLLPARRRSIEGGRNKGNGWHKEFQPWTSHATNKPFPFFSNSHMPRGPWLGDVGYFRNPLPFLTHPPYTFLLC